MNQLPIYKGYTVDYRLKEFRKIEMDKLPQWISFDSDEGDDLLCEMIDNNLVPRETLINLF